MDEPAWRPAWGLIALAGAIVAGVAAWAWPSSPAEPPAQVVAAAGNAGTSPSAPVTAVAASPGASGRAMQAAVASASTASASAKPAPRIVRTRDPNGDQTPDISDYINDGEKPTMGEVIQRLHQAGITTGLGAFSPPGTRPPLVGLAVPEDFVLPEGYVRHYQATDDGQRIEPILMFAPDHEFFDAAHRPIAIPKDRVVPPELAPPGMPIRRIVIPAPVDPGR